MSAAVAVGPSANRDPAGSRPPTRRNTELALLGFALAITTGLSVAVEAGAAKEITVSSLIGPFVIGLIFGGAHLGIRFLAPYADPIILPCVALLNGIGAVFIRRLDLAELAADERAGASLTSGESFMQLVWMGVGVAGFIGTLALVRDHRSAARWSYSAGLFGVVFVMIPAVLPGRFSEINGAKLWIIIPGVGQIQPGEFAKLALMIFFGSYLVAKRDVLSLASKRFLGMDFPRGRDLGPVVAVWLASLLVLVFEQDLGTSLMYFGIFIVMLYIATERTSWLIIGLLLFCGGAYGSYLFVSRVQLRVSIWLDPFADADDQGFQLVQALFGLGTGGLFGTGPGTGNPQLVPFASSDFITSTIGEEMGLFGLGAVLILYMLISARGIRAALDVRDSFGKLLAGGISFSLGLQVFVIVGGVSKLIPLTGLTTPFLSYGGSSMMANWLLIAFLIRISDAGRKPSSVKMPPLQLRDAPTEVVRL